MLAPFWSAGEPDDGGIYGADILCRPLLGCRRRLPHAPSANMSSRYPSAEALFFKTRARLTAIKEFQAFLNHIKSSYVRHASQGAPIQVCDLWQAHLIMDLSGSFHRFHLIPSIVCAAIRYSSSFPRRRYCSRVTRSRIPCLYWVRALSRFSNRGTGGK